MSRGEWVRRTFVAFPFVLPFHSGVRWSVITRRSGCCRQHSLPSVKVLRIEPVRSGRESVLSVSITRRPLPVSDQSVISIETLSHYPPPPAETGAALARGLRRSR
jgi:hypothetical protein